MHAAVAKALDSLESAPRRGLALALTLAVLLRLPFLDAPLQSDEGGFLMVAGQWTGGGSSLYGDQWVDRPPLLLVIFRLATVVGDSAVTLRVLALLFGLITVLAAWWAGRLINGARGGLAAAVVAAAISSSFSFAGFALTGEGIAVAFVMVSCALTLQATYDGRTSSEGLDPPDRQRSLGRGGARALLLAASAGMLAAMAFLVKQNFIDAGLFAAVVFAAAVRTNWRLLAAGAAGLLLPLVTTVVWADSDEGPGLVKLWHAVFWFRVRAVEVIHSAADSMPLDRLAGRASAVRRHRSRRADVAALRRCSPSRRPPAAETRATGDVRVRRLLRRRRAAAGGPTTSCSSDRCSRWAPLWRPDGRSLGCGRS